MDIKVLMGHKVIHNLFGVGEIVEVVNSNLFSVDFNGIKKQFEFESLGKFFRFEDDETSKLVHDLIEEAKAEAAAEEAKKAEDKRRAAAEAERKADKKKKKDKSNEEIPTYIQKRRGNGKHAIFLVCQTKNNFQIESANGIIWAQPHKRGERRGNKAMDIVQKGDIIFHHIDKTLFAISVAKTDFMKDKAAVEGHINAGEKGRCVELSYHILETPVSTKDMKADKAKYGTGEYGAFDRNGNNKQGVYISGLGEQLAQIFIDAAIKENPNDAMLLTIKSEI